MTPEEVAARNRANAQKSTGPRTAAGKAVVAQNARRHGATSRPDPASVAAWLEIILDDPDAAGAALEPGDERGLRALALAEAEARLVLAEQALIAFEGAVGRPDPIMEEFLGWGEGIRQEVAEGVTTRAEARADLDIVDILVRMRSADIEPGRRRHRLLRRYLGEARAARRHALRAWVEINAPGRGWAA
ncbi:MAG: hypothetical protein NXH83_19465 [Rhodobacteraceae bacterium]|nr:hypothetical protein [Paracoccaceae bacterium]